MYLKKGERGRERKKKHKVQQQAGREWLPAIVSLINTTIFQVSTTSQVAAAGPRQAIRWGDILAK